LFGGSSIDKYDEPLHDSVLKNCLNSDAVFLGAVGGPQWENLEHHKKPEAGLLKLRKELGLFANLRPAKVYTSMLQSSSLKPSVLDGTDILILRELTGGIYFGSPKGYDKEKGWSTMVYEREEIERIARKAFELAYQRDMRVTSVDKANVLDVSQFWRDVVAEVHNDYADVKLNNMYVDNAAMQLVRDPKQFDVILTSNMFGDILSDIGGMITGSLGMLPSASLGESHSLYEPVHGSAPDIAGQNKANPIAAISSAAMMLKYTFATDKASTLIEQSIENILNHGYRTADIHNEGDILVSTTEMTDLVLEEFDRIYNDEALHVFTL
jgi:3-isopropylmalate dehydrogenase